MKFKELFRKIVDESPLAEIIYLEHYKEKRKRLYPGVAFRVFTDFKSHKRWMAEEAKKELRKEHNKRVLKEFKEEKKRA